MRRDHRRHPFFETLVFGLAIVLVVILFFYGGRAYFNMRAADQGALKPSQDVGKAPSQPEAELPHQLNISPMVRGVDRLPPVQIVRPGKTSNKAKAVPVPQ